MGVPEASLRIEGPNPLDPRIYLHGAGETTGMKRKKKKKQFKNALDSYQPEDDAQMENSCCVSEAHLARVTDSRSRHVGPAACLDSIFLPWPELTLALTNAHHGKVEKGVGSLPRLRKAPVSQ